MAGNKQNNDSAITKHACLFGLVMSWIVGVTALFLGGICLFHELRDGIAVHLKIEDKWREILPLLLNIVVTLLNNSMGYIHSCTLRWALHREGLLEFNSNLRLLRVSKSSWPNGGVANGICFLGIIMSYGSTSLVFLSMNPDLADIIGRSYLYHVGHEGVHINSIALFTLAAGLLSQAFITNWAMGRTEIPTWSSNPLDVVRACLHDDHDGHRIEPRAGRCMMSVHLAQEETMSLRPTPTQKPMATANFRVQRILILLFFVPIIGVVWGGSSTAYVARYQVSGSSWTMIPTFTMEELCDGGQYCGTSVLNVWWTTTNGALGTFGGVVLVMLAQSIVTVSLQCAELLVNLSRDEKIYRTLIGPKGTNSHYNSVWAAFTSWETLFLFVLKACVHWIFGLAINLQCEVGVNMYPPQIFYFSVFSLVTAVFGLYLALRRPQGYLPATYGHIQTMADVIDEWSDSGCMFWGEKDPGDWYRGIPGYTGTSTERLNAPDERQFYGGQREMDDGWRLRHKASKTTIPSRTVIPPRGSSIRAASIGPQPVPNPHPTQTYTQWAEQQRFPSPWRRSSIRHSSASSMHSAYSNYSRRSDHSTQPFLSEHR